MTIGRRLLSPLASMLSAICQGRRILARPEVVRGGFYRAEGSVVWRRLGTKLPPFLEASKVPRAGGRRVPLMLWVRGRGQAEIAVTTFEGGSLYLDLRRGEVTRHYPPGCFVSEEEVELRRRFEAVVGSPRARYAADGCSHTEDLVQGRHLHDLTAGERLAAVRDVVEQFGELTRIEGTGDSTPEILAALARAARMALPAQLEGLIEGAQEAMAVLVVPWVPSAREATLKNLVIREDLSGAPIDLGDLAMLPSTWYPLGIVSESGLDVMTGYRRGELDTWVLELVREIEPQALRRRPCWRDEMLAARLVYAAARDAADGLDGTALPRDDVMHEGLLRRWGRLKPHLA